MISAKIIADSISEAGKRITTLQLIYPRLIHSEFMTHRVFSRNASSSRAIPVKKMLQMIRDEPAMPIHWGKNQPGMQAAVELTGADLEEVKSLWIRAATCAVNAAELMEKRGAHKQVVNRILEPFQHIQVVLTATEFDNWDELRDHEDADPNIHELARQVKFAREGSTPKLLLPGEWHLPYVTEEERASLSIDLAKKVSSARCCRVSYLKHDGTAASVQDDLDLCEKLAGARPIHASPFEHQATPIPDLDFANEHLSGVWADIVSGIPEGVSHIDMKGRMWSGNFEGWIQHRKLIEAQFNS